jgi:phosphoribosylformimino-5-aminoimidazole carboxamide ribotide isomerase
MAKTSMSSHFTVYPAIDLRNGQVVRLRMGDPTQQTTYSNDPAQIGRQWQQQGAQWLHVVNLDGAFGETNSPNLQVLPSLVALGIAVQFGGGLRDLAGIRQILALGVQRVVLGTVAVTQPDLVTQALAEFGAERVAVGIDARDGWVRTHGWQSGGAVSALALAQQLASVGLQTVVFTDIARDGVGSGLNIASTAQLAQASGLLVIASGGVHRAADVQAARQAGLAGCIIGRALYEGSIAHLSEVL